MGRLAIWLTLATVIMSAAPVAAQGTGDQDRGPLIITRAFADEALTVLTVDGFGFGTTPLFVTLNGQPVELLHRTRRQLQLQLPATIAPGSHAAGHRLGCSRRCQRTDLHLGHPSG